jgi:hypothetical protein
MAVTATQLVLSNDLCLIQPCGPHLPPARVVQSGVPFGIYVAALNDQFGLDFSYLGTINFSSTDPSAVLPPSFTFLPADRGDRDFTAILRTPGDQTITVTDSMGRLRPGTLIMTVTGPTLAGIPTISGWAKVLILFGLAFSGICLVRQTT